MLFLGQSRSERATARSSQRFVTDDGRFVYVYERYADATAALKHLRRFMQTFSNRFGDMVDRKRFMVLGEPTDDLKFLLDRYGATYLKPFGPFAMALIAMRHPLNPNVVACGRRDTANLVANDRNGSSTDVPRCRRHVCFTPTSGH
jgi:hypothetical protein